MESDAQFVRDLYHMVNLRAWEFLIPMAAAIVGGYLGIFLFWVTRAVILGMQRKKVKLIRGLEEAEQRILEAKAELSDTLKENRQLKRVLINYEKRARQGRAESRAIIELAKADVKP